uniref:CRAL-TRIO domain-containing protein n=1 Tax=Trichogramma kaykai TaxID=54128 RepID=A0ABD2XKG1_9HYME
MKLGHELAESRGRWPRLTDDLLAELQSWAGGHGLPEVPPEQLAIFAHSCHYEREATLACMDCYYRLRAQVPDFFAARDPTSQASLNALKVVYFAALPKPDKQGNRIIFHGLADGAPSRYQFADSVKLLLMSMDASLHEVGCVPGHVFLFDMRGVGIGHLTRLSLAGIKRFFEYIQDAMPVRLKAIHVLNCVWFIDRVLALVKPFMKKELMDISSTAESWRICAITSKKRSACSDALKTTRKNYQCPVPTRTSPRGRARRTSASVDLHPRTRHRHIYYMNTHVCSKKKTARRENMCFVLLDSRVRRKN